MLTSNLRRVSLLACFAVAVVAAADSKTEQATIAVQGGTATFIAKTNVPAVSIKGKSTAMVAKLTLRRSEAGVELEHIDAGLPVKTLLTGMGMRDEHMHKYIFTAAGGQVPDLHFEGEKATCSSAGKDITCQLAGMHDWDLAGEASLPNTASPIGPSS